MERIQVRRNLFLDEYIPKDTYLAFQTKGNPFYGWAYDSYTRLLKRKLNPLLLDADQKLRDHFGPVTINNWWDGGPRAFSGFRPTWCPVGGVMSDHREGNASDKIFSNFDAETVRMYIEEHYKELGITIIEAGTSWVHSAVSWTDMPTLLIVQP